MDKNYKIYMHRNKINGKCYVGQTCQKPETRWGKNGWHYHEQEYFWRAIQKYGWDNFEHIILEENLTAEEADIQEAFWAGYYHALAPEGYTLHVGARERILNTQELSNIRSQASFRNWENPDYRRKVIEGRQVMWQEADEEKKKKMLANLDRSGNGGKAKSKEVECIETHIIYHSINEASRQTGIPSGNISLVCNNKRKTAGKYHWRFI